MRALLIGVGAVAVAVALVVGMSVLLTGSNDRGQLAVSVHDAPCNGCSHVWVTFTAVSVHEANSGANGSGGDDGNGSGEGSDHQCGNGTGNESGNDSDDQSDNDSGNESGDDGDHGSGNQSGNGSMDDLTVFEDGNGSGNESGDDAGHDCGDQSGGDSGDGQGGDGGNDSGNDSGNESGNDTGHHCGNESGNESGDDSGNQSGNDSGNDSGGDSGDGLGADSAVMGNSGSMGGWITLNVTGQTIDLAALNGSSFAQTIGILSLPAGHYDQIRLAISQVVVQLATGTNVTAKLAGNGFALAHGEFTVAAGATTHVSIDIDLGTSVHVEGNGAVMFTPNIGAVTVS